MPVSTTTLVLAPGSPLHWFLELLQRIPSLGLLILFSIIAALGPRPLADYLVLTFAAFALINILIRPVSMDTIGPAAAAAIAFIGLNSRIAGTAVRTRLRHGWTWLQHRLSADNPPRRNA